MSNWPWRKNAERITELELEIEQLKMDIEYLKQFVAMFMPVENPQPQNGNENIMPCKTEKKQKRKRKAWRITPTEKLEIIGLYTTGDNIRTIATRTGYSKTTVWRVIDEYKRSDTEYTLLNNLEPGDRFKFHLDDEYPLRLKGFKGDMAIFIDRNGKEIHQTKYMAVFKIKEKNNDKRSDGQLDSTERRTPPQE
jgi:hypothetical protein